MVLVNKEMYRLEGLNGTFSVSGGTGHYNRTDERDTKNIDEWLERNSFERIAGGKYLVFDGERFCTIVLEARDFNPVHPMPSGTPFTYNVELFAKISPGHLGVPNDLAYLLKVEGFTKVEI